jgi:hypothetical protein
MKWNGSNVDRTIFRHIIGRGDDGRGKRDGIPNIIRSVIADLDPVGTARMLDGNELAACERLDRGLGFLDAFVPQNAQMHLAIGGRMVTENFRPIDVPVSKKRVGIARDGEEKGAAIGARKFSEVFVIVRRGG